MLNEQGYAVRGVQLLSEQRVILNENGKIYIGDVAFETRRCGAGGTQRRDAHADFFRSGIPFEARSLFP